MTENDISYKIRGAIYEVYKNLGPGLLESVYEAVLTFELQKLGLKVENKVIIEIKSVENLAEVHHKQVLTYLRLTGLKLGLLVNFNSDDILKSVYRKVNNL